MVEINFHPPGFAHGEVPPSALQASRGPDSKDRPHHHPQVPGRDVHQVAFGHVHQFAEPTPSRSACLTCVREAPFGVLTAQTAQSLPSLPANPATIPIHRVLLFVRLVRPATIVTTLPLGNVGPKPSIPIPRPIMIP